MRSAINCILFLLVQASLSGCIPTLAPTPAQEVSAPPLTAEQFSTRIRNLQNDVASPKSADPIRTGKIHRELAHLHLSTHNPNRNLDQAASELNKYLETEQDPRAQDDARNMLELLKDINARDKEIAALQKKVTETSAAVKLIREKNAQIKKLSSENKSLKKRQKELLADKKRLEMTIEKLKFLDLNLEKKRKTFR